MSLIYVLKRVQFSGEEVIENREQLYTCGRGKDNEIVCPSMLVSRQHCIFNIRKDGLYIQDLKSSNGVFVNGEKKCSATKLNENDKIGIGFPELEPMNKDSFIYSLHIKKNNAKDPQVEDAVVPASPIPVKIDRIVAGHQKNLKIFEKKRPGEVNESLPLKKLKATDPVPSTSFAVGLPVDINSIKPDPDDDIQIIEVYSPADQNGSKTTKVSKSNKPKAEPSEIAIKLSERRTERFKKPEEKRIDIVSNLSERLTEIISKSDDKQAEVSSTDNGRRSEICRKPEEKRLELSNESSERCLELSNKLSVNVVEISNKSSVKYPEMSIKKDCRVVITSIENLNRNSALDLQSLITNNVNKSSVNKNETNPRRKSCNLKVSECHIQPKEPEFTSKPNQTACKANQSLPKPSNSSENHSGSSIKNSNKENMQNGHMTNGYVPALDNIKIKEESSNVNTSSSADKKLELILANNMQKKVSGSIEAKRNRNVSRSLPNSFKPKHCDKSLAKETSSKVNTSNNIEEAMETNYQSDDELFVVAEIVNNDNFNCLGDFSKLTNLDDPKAFTSSPIKLKAVKEEPKTCYSEHDVVCLSSDDDDDENVFPCSQLFDSVNEKPIVKQEPTEEGENEVREPKEEEDIIVLSDSDDEDNPWFNRLFNSQVYRPSQDFCVKTEPDEEVEQTITADEFGLEPLLPEEEEEEKEDKSRSETSKRSQVLETEEQDDDVWNENIQSQETADKEARFFEKQTSKVLAESGKKIPKSAFEITCESKQLRRPRPEQETDKQPKKKIRKTDIVYRERKEDTFLEEEENENFTRESSAFEEVQQSIKAFEDSCAKRKSSEDAHKGKNLQEKKKDQKDEDSRKASKLFEGEKEIRRYSKDGRQRQKEFEDDRENRKFHLDDRERRKSSADIRERRRASDEDEETGRVSLYGREKNRSYVEDRERGRRSVDNREERRNSDEIRERKKNEDTRDRRRESEKGRGRRNDHEDNRERYTENEEKRARRKQDEEYQARKKRREEEEYQAKRKEQDAVKEKKRSSDDDRKNAFEFEPEKRKTTDEVFPRLFEDGPPKTKKVEDEIKKLDKEFGNVTLHKSFTIPKFQPKNVAEVSETSKLPQNTSRPAEVGVKKPKNWESELKNIDEKALAIKAKQSLRRVPVLIQPPYMPKGEKRGMSVSVFRNNNDYTEGSLLTEEELKDEISKSEAMKIYSSVKTPRKRHGSINHKSRENLPRVAKEQKEIRKEKLKLLTTKKPSTDENTSVANDRPKAKAIVKVTHKSRQDTLLFDQQKTAAIKPGIAHQRMNNVQSVAHCSKSIPELIKSKKDKISSNRLEEKSQTAKTESKSREEIRSPTLEEQEQEEMLRDLASLEFEPVSPGDMEMNDTGDNKKDEVLKPAFVTSKTNDMNKTDETKKSRRSCLVSFSSNAFREKPQKKVRWDLTSIQVREFEIDKHNSLRRVVGKDAPINRPKPQFESKIDEYLSRIFNWNPNWLEEQKELSHEPPVYRGDKLHPMKNHYASVTDYCNILRPLLLLEIWNALSKESECEEKRYKFRMLFCSVVANSITRAKTSGGEPQTNFMLEVVMSRDDFKKDLYPGPGHLIILEFPIPREEKDTNKPSFQRIFAYVENKCHTPIMENTRYNRELSTKRLANDPEMLLTFSVLARQGINLPTEKICRMRGVMYLKSNMREILALQNFPTSPLERLILCPTIEDYQLPEVYLTEQNPLVTKDALNERQIEAVMKISEAALSEKPQISLIHGPPGTGKSKVIVNMVTQILSKGPNTQILVCAPSNAAVDELVLRLLQIRSKLNLKNIKMVRVGRPEAMNHKVKNVSLTELGRKQVEKEYSFTAKDEQIRKEDEAKLQKFESLINLIEERINDVRRNGVKGNITQLLKQRQDLEKNCKQLQTKISNRVDIKKLNPAEVNRIHRNTEELMLSKATVIACTLSSCYSGIMEKIFGGKKGIKIPICIVDEATQSCETENLIPLMLGVKKLILVGDTNQLPATVLSKLAKEMGLAQSLFSRIQKTFEHASENPIIMLNTQYRMDYPILSWPNSYFYQGKLIDKATVKEVPYSSYRILNLNSYQDESKFSNENEAEFVSKIIFIMVTCVDLSFREQLTIGVITPYQHQRNLILSKIERRLDSVSSDRKSKFSIEVNTVDSFQGQERDVIIMSCVRSNGIGFMSDRQRLCVALTRAKSSLLLCGNFKTFQKDDMWNELLTDAKNRNIFINVQANANLDGIKSHVLR